MNVDVDFILLLALGLSLAFILGMIAKKLGLPTILGYMVAGLLISPNLHQNALNLSVAHQMAELGIIFLMFEVGMHFSWRELNTVKSIAVPGALIQMCTAILAGSLVGWLWGWNIIACLTFGLSLSVASTIVLIRGLAQTNQLKTINGKIAIGWLVVEDIMTVLALITLPILADVYFSNGQNTEHSVTSLITQIALTLLKVLTFVFLILTIGKKFIPKLLSLVAKEGNKELFTICIVSLAVGIAFIAYKYFDVSMALGAFIAGMVVKQAHLSNEIEEHTEALKDVFSVLFFVSVGMLFDVRIFIQDFEKVLIVVLIIMLVKTFSAWIIILSRGYPLYTALIVGAGLAQIGEFSFILSALAGQLKILNTEAQQLILAGAFISIALNPLLFKNAKALEKYLTKRSRFAHQLAHRIDKLSMLPDYTSHALLNQQIIIVGYGEVGKKLYNTLLEDEHPMVVIDYNRELIEGLRKKNIAAVFGDAIEPMTLVQAHVHKANTLVITHPELFDVHQISKTARMLNPQIEILICTESITQKKLIETEDWGRPFYTKQSLVLEITNYIRHKNS